MRKFILGISLFFGGIIGFIGWVISIVINNGGMRGLSIIEILEGSDLLVSGIFISLVLIGLFISLFECKKD